MIMALMAQMHPKIFTRPCTGCVSEAGVMNECTISSATINVYVTAIVYFNLRKVSRRFDEDLCVLVQTYAVL